MMALFFEFLFFVVPLMVAQKPAENDQKWFLSAGGTTCCECVPYFQCIDGKLKKPGQSKNVNVKKCESEVEFCCLAPNAPNICSSFQPGPMPKVNTDPQPNKACSCVHYETCAPEKVVTDGNGIHSDFGLTTHSKCPKQFDVCCHETHDHGNAGPQVGPRVRQPHEGDCDCVPREQCVDGVPNTDGIGIIQPRGRADHTCTNDGDVCCSPKPGGSGNKRNGNCLILTGFVTFVSAVKVILM